MGSGKRAAIVRRSDGALPTRRRPVHWTGEGNFRVLALDGGGIKGLFTTALLAGLERLYLDGRSIASYFDYIAGTSTGGIIALGLANGLTASEIHNFYVKHGGIIFPRDRKFGVLRSAYDAAPLRDLVLAALENKALGDARSRLAIPSCEGRHGDINVFKTPHHPDFKMDWKILMTDVAMATSAAPTYLPIHNIGDHDFIDGGIWGNTPTMVALTDILSCYDIPRDKIDILSIGTGAKRPKLRGRDRALGGIVTWLLSGGFLLENFMYYSSANALGQTYLLIGKDRCRRIEPSETLSEIGLGNYRAALERLLPEAERLLVERGPELASIFLGSPAAEPVFYHGSRAAVA